MATLNPFTSAKRLVVKIGSAQLVDPETGELRTKWLGALAVDIKKLHKQGVEVILVSSGAIALGRGRLGMIGQTLSLSQKQACAATGQSLLTRHYEDALAAHELNTAQALLTLNDTENRRRWLNARSTLETLLGLDVIPIINENDTVSTIEIRYGDNDRLAARTAQMLSADTLILLSDIDGLYTQDPRNNPDAQHIEIIETIDDDIIKMGGGANQSSGIGTGGMATKLLAAQIAQGAGCHMAIMDGRELSPLSRLMQGAKATWFKAAISPKNARDQWISGTINPRGTLTIDTGAEAALNRGKSLLSAGVVAVEGEFEKGDTVSVVNQGGEICGHGLVAYDSVEARRIMGQKSQDAALDLGYDKVHPIIHRDNLVWEPS
ncbi:MAG: glutamate 5-kinase [Maricaulaceae bacterium]